MKTIVSPAFGRRLIELRGKRTRPAVVRWIRDNYGIAFDATTLTHWEKGRVRAPDPGPLWALCQLYGADLRELVSLLVTERTGRATGRAQPGISKALSEDEASLLEAFGRAREKDRHLVLFALGLQRRDADGEHARRTLHADRRPAEAPDAAGETGPDGCAA